jgi:CheY-like chemotaxis protein
VFWFTIPYRPDRLSASVASAEVQEADALEERTDEQCANRHVHQHSTAPTLDDGHKSLPPQCVLVVDDAALIVKMTSMLLSRKGHTVESAVNGAEALEKLVQGYERTRSGSLGGDGEQAEGRSTPYDVVLMDLQMPVLDGLEAIRRLRAWEARAHGSGVPAVFGTEAPVITAVLIAGFLHKPYHQLVIALSANSDEETRLEALEAGADAFMAKPFSYENFLGVMETCSQK